MAAVVGVGFGNDSSGERHGLVIVDVLDPSLTGIGLIHTVETDDILRRLCLGIPEESVTGRERAKDRDDIVRFCYVAHRLYAGDDILEVYLTVVARYIVYSGHDGHGAGVKVHDVLLEAGEHVLDRLTADTPADIVVGREKTGPHLRPIVGDGIAHEHYKRRLRDAGIRFCITVETGPVHGSPVLRLRIGYCCRQNG